MDKKGEGAAKITVYFEKDVPDDTKVLFIRYVHDHISAKAQDVVRERLYICPHCDTPAGNDAVQKRLQRGEKDILCGNCEERFLLWDLIEEMFSSEEMQRRVREMAQKALAGIDNESKDLILVGHAFAIAGEAGQIFRPTPNSDWGIDGEIEFKNNKGEASGQRVYLQLKSGDSYLHIRKSDGKEIFPIKNARWAKYWLAQAYPVMLVVRNASGETRWMNVTEYLRRKGKKVRQIEFEGEPFTALNVFRLRDRMLGVPPLPASGSDSD